MTEIQEWVRRGCAAELFDASQWPVVRYAGVQMSVPPTHHQTSVVPDQFFVRTPRGALVTWRHRDARYRFDEVNRRVRPGQVNCAITYGSLPAQVLSWSERGEFGTAILVAPQWEGEDSDKWLFAMVRSRDLSEARVLRHMLRTIAAVAGREPRP